MLKVCVSVLVLFISLATGNVPPNTPVINEPEFDAQLVNPSDVHMESSAFSDDDPGDAGMYEVVVTNPCGEAISQPVLLTVVDCRADFNGDSQPDFFDVQSFLQAFSSQDPSVDFIADSVFDFFDVQAFLGVFAAGCP